jgi:hypothetical protein
VLLTTHRGGGITDSARLRSRQSTSVCVCAGDMNESYAVQYASYEEKGRADEHGSQATDLSPRRNILFYFAKMIIPGRNPLLGKCGHEIVHCHNRGARVIGAVHT